MIVDYIETEVLLTGINTSAFPSISVLPSVISVLLFFITNLVLGRAISLVVLS